MSRSGKLLSFREQSRIQGNSVSDFNEKPDDICICRIFESPKPININQSDIVIPEGITNIIIPLFNT